MSPTEMLKEPLSVLFFLEESANKLIEMSREK